VGQRNPNNRLVKLHRNYTVEEIARLLGKHKNTVREWTKAGLPTIDIKRPTLILGRELIAFLQARRAKRKQPCGPWQMYCVGCRTPKFPAAGMLECQRLTEKVGNLTAICPDCHSLMNRRVSLARIGEFRGKMDLTSQQALRHIGEISQPSVNSDLKGDIQL
jgi:Helix-turn-helix domain